MDVSGTRYILKMQSYLFRFLRLFGCLLCLPWSQKSTFCWQWRTNLECCNFGRKTFRIAWHQRKNSSRQMHIFLVLVCFWSVRCVKSQHVSTDTKNVSFLRIFSRLFNEIFVWNCERPFFEDTAGWHPNPTWDLRFVMTMLLLIVSQDGPTTFGFGNVTWHGFNTKLVCFHHFFMESKGGAGARKRGACL